MNKKENKIKDEILSRIANGFEIGSNNFLEETKMKFCNLFLVTNENPIEVIDSLYKNNFCTQIELRTFIDELKIKNKTQIACLPKSCLQDYIEDLKSIFLDKKVNFLVEGI